MIIIYQRQMLCTVWGAVPFNICLAGCSHKGSTFTVNIYSLSKVNLTINTRQLLQQEHLTLRLQPILTISTAGNRSKFSNFCKIQFLLPYLDLAMKTWVQTSLVLVHWFLRKPHKFGEKGIKFNVFHTKTPIWRALRRVINMK